MLGKIFQTKKSQAIFIVIFCIVITGFFGGFLKISPETFTQFTYIFTGLLIGYGVFFETEKIENFLLNNLTKISFILIIGFFLLPAGFVEINKEIFYIIGAIFAFWYGYKKYERDKELEIHRNGLYPSKSLNYEENIEKWFNLIHLEENGYISKKLFLKTEQSYMNHLEDEFFNSESNDIRRFKIIKLLLRVSTREHFRKHLYGLVDALRYSCMQLNNKNKESMILSPVGNEYISVEKIIKNYSNTIDCIEKELNNPALLPHN